MNKEDFVLVLNTALWYYIDGMSEQQILDYAKINPNIVKAGIKLSLYLQEFKIKKQEHPTA
jgi:hypothetical protein